MFYIQLDLLPGRFSDGINGTSLKKHLNKTTRLTLNPRNNIWYAGLPHDLNPVLSRHEHDQQAEQPLWATGKPSILTSADWRVPLSRRVSFKYFKNTTRIMVGVSSSMLSSSALYCYFFRLIFFQAGAFHNLLKKIQKKQKS